MQLRLITKNFLTYGVWRLVGKVTGVFLFVAAPAAADPVTVLALGDSLTQGYGLPEEEGLVPQLDRWLDENGIEVELINGGVSGDTTAGGAARVDWSLTPEIGGMIVALGGNDLLRGIAPEVARGNLERILKAAQSEGVEVLLVGMTAPGNYGQDYKTEFDAIYPELAQEYDALLFRNFFAGLNEDDPAEARRFFQPDGIHPNSEGVARIVEALGPAVSELVARVK